MKTCEVAAKSKLISRKARETIETKDKRTMWNVLREYIHKYSKLFTMVNGVLLKQVNTDFYENVSEEDISRQLEIVIGLIYLNDSKHCAAKEMIKTCFKKLLKQSGMFRNQEIEVLL